MPGNRRERAFARSRPRHVPMTLAGAAALAKRLLKDRRFLALRPLGRVALLWAALERADGEGAFWVSWETWGKGVGASSDGVRKAVSPAFEEEEDATEFDKNASAGLLRVERYLRPPSSSQQGQGANTY